LTAWAWLSGCADQTRLEVGGCQSTSNAMAGNNIVVDTDQPLIWTAQFHDPLERA
jgi:hypothetical protein